MDATDMVKSAFNGAHMWFNGTTADITDEQANAVPPGKCHPIGALMAHIIQDEDFMLTTFVMGGKPSLWEQRWSAKLDIPLVVDLGDKTDEAVTYDPAALREYAQDVFAQLDAHLATMTAADLEREIDMTAAGMGRMPAGTFLTTMLVGNTYAHTGEISTLKGLLGATGYPF